MYDRTNLEGLYSWVGRLAIAIMFILLVTWVALAEPAPSQKENMPEGLYETEASVLCVVPPVLKELLSGFTMVFEGTTAYGAFNYLFANEDGRYYIVHVQDGTSCLFGAGPRHRLLGIDEGDEVDEDAE